MKLGKNLFVAAATLTLALAAGAVVLPAIGDPTPSARGEPIQVPASVTGLRGRDTGGDRALELRVIDGDTLEDMAADITYRVVNIDTPETGPRARCRAERELGDRATHQARTLIGNAASVELRPTGRIDRYGRTIAFVLIDGRDLGETLIAEGLARPWRGRREPWCDAGGNLLP